MEFTGRVSHLTSSCLVLTFSTHRPVARHSRQCLLWAVVISSLRWCLPDTEETFLRYNIPVKSLLSSDVRSSGPFHLELVGQNRVKLTPTQQSDNFLGEDIGRIYELSDGRGAGQIVEVTTESGIASAILDTTVPFVKSIPNQSTISIGAADGAGNVDIDITVGTWSTGDIRSSVVVLYCTSFLITDFSSPTRAVTVPLDAAKAANCVGTITGNQWFSVNVDPYKSLYTVPISDQFTVTSTSPSVTMTTTGTLDSGVVGTVVTLPSYRRGLVTSLTSGYTIEFTTDDSFTNSESFDSWEVTFSDLGSGLLVDGSTYPRKSSIQLSEPTCDIVFVEEDLSPISHPVSGVNKFIDTWKDGNVAVRVLDYRSLAVSPPRFEVHFENRDMFHFYTTINNSASFTEMHLHLTHNQSSVSAYTPVLITPADHAASLRCEVPGLLYSVVQDCGPQTRIFLRYPGISDKTDFLNPDILNPDSGDKLLTELPANYRPPSIHGRDIPSSSNVYNADPQLPMPRNLKEISADSPVYKQCLNAANVAACGCTDDMRISDSPLHSDCKQNVYTVSYTTLFTPDLYFVRYGKPDERLNNSYVLTEVNGREEFEIFKDNVPTSSNTCNATNCAIGFLGSELFHFRVTVISDTICSYQTEFLLYVVNVPLSKTLHNTIATYVVVAMFLIILIYYLSTKRVVSKFDMKDPPQAQRKLSATSIESPKL